MKTQTHLGNDAFDLLILDNQVIAGLLKYPQVGLVFQNFAHGSFVQHPIGLGASGTHGWTFTAIEDTELDAAEIGGSGHGSAEGIDFLDQMALADPANGRIAAHLPKRLDVVRQQQGFYPHAGSSKRCFGTGMAAADHDHIKTGREIHHAPRAC